MNECFPAICCGLMGLLTGVPKERYYPYTHSLLLSLPCISESVDTAAFGVPSAINTCKQKSLIVFAELSGGIFEAKKIQSMFSIVRVSLLVP